MPTVSATKRQLRSMLLRNLLQRDDYLVETPSGATSSLISYSQAANRFPSNHFVGGEIRCTVTNDETRRIASMSASTMSLTPVTNFSGTPTSGTVQVLRSPHSFDMFDSYLERAVWELSLFGTVPKTDETLMTERGRMIYPAPAWTEVNQVWLDYQKVTGDYYAPTNDRNYSEATIEAVATELSQGIKVYKQMYVNAVWLMLRTVGDPVGNIAVNIRSNNSGTPTGGAGGILGTSSNVAMATGLSDQYRWVRFEFTSPVVLAAETVYHLCLNPDSGATLSSSAYVAWQHSTDAGYGDGAPATSSDSGANWSAASGLDRFFRVTDARSDEWRQVNWKAWDVVPSTSRQLRLPPPFDGVPRPVRLIGQSAPSELSTDSTSTELNPSLVVTMATALYHEGNAANDPNAARLAPFFRQRAEQEWAQTEVLRPRRLLEIQ